MHMLLSASSSSILYSFFTTLASEAQPFAVIISLYESVCVCMKVCVSDSVRCDVMH